MTTKERIVFTPRFDFGSNVDPIGKQTGTVKELLEELNYEKFKTITGTDAKKKRFERDIYYVRFAGRRVRVPRRGG